MVFGALWLQPEGRSAAAQGHSLRAPRRMGLPSYCPGDPVTAQSRSSLKVGITYILRAAIRVCKAANTTNCTFLACSGPIASGHLSAKTHTVLCSRHVYVAMLTIRKMRLPNTYNQVSWCSCLMTEERQKVQVPEIRARTLGNSAGLSQRPATGPKITASLLPQTLAWGPGTAPLRLFFGPCKGWSVWREWLQIL